MPKITKNGNVIRNNATRKIVLICSTFNSGGRVAMDDASEINISICMIVLLIYQARPVPAIEIFDISKTAGLAKDP